MTSRTLVQLAGIAGLFALATIGHAQGFTPVKELSDGLLATLDNSKLAIFLIGAIIAVVAAFFSVIRWGAAVGTIVAGGLLLGNMQEIAGFFNIT